MVFGLTNFELILSVGFGIFILLFLVYLVSTMVASRKPTPGTKKGLTLKEKWALAKQNKLKAQEKKIDQKHTATKYISEYAPVTFITINPLSWLSIIKWKNSWKKWFKADRSVLILMELNNGSLIQFLTAEEKGGFSYRGKEYILDENPRFKRWNLSGRYYMFYYHESCTLPIDIVIPMDKLKAKIATTKYVDNEMVMNPGTLKTYTRAKVIEGALRGAEIGSVFKTLKLLTFVNVFVSVATLAIVLFTSGLLEGVI